MLDKHDIFTYFTYNIAYIINILKFYADLEENMENIVFDADIRHKISGVSDIVVSVESEE